MTTRVYLHGALAQYGAHYDLNVRDAPEACRLLGAQIPGFRQDLVDGHWHVYRGPVEAGRTISEEALTLALGRVEEIHIMPAAAGAGDGILSIVGGAALFAAGVFTANPTLMIAGGAMAVGGVTQMLMTPSATSSYSDREEADERPSFLFDGPTNTSTQGLPVPLVYGRMRAGSIVVSSGITAEEIDLDADDEEGEGDNVVTNPEGAVSGSKGGGKGGGGGSQSVPSEDPNTLRSNSTAHLVDVVSEGPIVGLVNGWQSVYLDDTPVANEDGSYNYTGIRRTDRFGYPDQEPFPNQPYVEHPSDVSTQVTHDTPIVHTVTETAADAVRVTVQLPALSYQDPKTGDLQGSSVDWAVDIRPNGGDWVESLTDTIEGKTTSPYQRSKRVELPGEGPWDVRVRRVTEDNEESNRRNDIYWASYTSLIDAHLTYPDTAAFGLEVSAQQFGDSIPSRKYDIKGLIISVPSNYNPETREYSGIWDGTFKQAWTDNPAWIYYDLATNTRYGAGIPAVDTAELYTIAQYCDEMIDDGFGGTEPRYTINTVISDQSEVYDALNQIAGAFRGMTYWGDNSIMPVADMPREPVKLVTPANVIDGAFEYAGAARTAQHSAWLVSYNDINQNDRLTPEVVENQQRVQKYGWRPQNITAFGCNSRGLARRMGRWAEETEVHEGETVTYKAAADHADVRPGDIIKLQDPQRAGARLSGRFVAVGTQTLTLDKAPDSIDQSETWYLDAVLPDGRLERQQIDSWDGNTITLKTALTQAPIRGGVWILSSDSVEPRLWRVLSNKESGASSGSLRYQISALYHDPTKFARVEQGLYLDPPDTSLIPTGAIQPPKNITAETFTYLAGGTQHQGLTVSLTPSDDPRVTRYIIEAKGPSDTKWTTLSANEQVNADLRDADSGQYRVRARSVTGINQYSSWVYATVTSDGLLLPTPPDSIDYKAETFSITLMPRGGQTGQSWEFWQANAALQQNEIEANATKIGSGQSVTATDLVPDTLYLFYVYGINAYGKSETAGAVQVRTKNEPDAILKNISGQISDTELSDQLNDEIGKISGDGPGSVSDQINDRAEQIEDDLDQRADDLNNRLGDLRNDTTGIDLVIPPGGSPSVNTQSLLRDRGLQDGFDAGIQNEAQQRAQALLDQKNELTTDISNTREQLESEDESLASAISSLAAGSGEQFDVATIWYYDDDLAGWTGGTMANGFLVPDNSDTPFVVSPTGVGADGNSRRYVKARIKRHGTPTWAGVLYWKNAGDADWSGPATIEEPAFQSNGVTTISWEDIPWSGTIDQIRVRLTEAESDTDGIDIDWLAIGRPTPGASTAALQRERESRITADQAEASERNTLAAQLRGDYDGDDPAQLSQGLIYNERQARVTAEEATTDRLDSQQSSINDNSAAINDEAKTRAAADEAEAQSRRELRASLTGIDLVLPPGEQPTPATKAQVTANVAQQNSTNVSRNTDKIEAQSQSLTQVQSRIGALKQDVQLGFETGQVGQQTAPDGWTIEGDAPTQYVAAFPGSDYGSTLAYGYTGSDGGAWGIKRTFAIPQGGLFEADVRTRVLSGHAYILLTCFDGSGNQLDQFASEAKGADFEGTITVSATTPDATRYVQLSARASALSDN